MSDKPLSFRDVIRFHVVEASEKILKLKEECKTPVVIIRRTHLQGLALGADSNKMTLHHIQPRHPRWDEYRLLKREVSVLLTAGHLNKWMDERNLTPEAMEHDSFLTFIHSGGTKHHCNKLKQVETAKAALTTVDQLLAFMEGELHHIVAWLKEQEKQAAARKATSGVDSWANASNAALTPELVKEQLSGIPGKAVASGE